MTVLTKEQAIAVGSIVTFGTYPQTESGTDRTPIEWQVLDVQEGTALLLSKYGLDAQPYNATNTRVTWETSTLHSWLNDEFLNRAFTPEEQVGIVTSWVPNDSSQGYDQWKTNGGSDTLDQVFLLSYQEANHYLGVVHSSGSSKDNPKACVHPTPYAIAQGAIEDEEYYTTTEGTSAGFWWLRSPGSNPRQAANVFVDGNLDLQPVQLNTLCVRPALWVDLSAEVF